MLADYLEYRPWKTLNQGTESTCQAYAFFGCLMEHVENEFNRQVEFNIEHYFEVIKDIFKTAPKNEGSKPRQWYYYEYGMKYGFPTKTHEIVKLNGFRYSKEVKNHLLIMKSLQAFGPMQIAVRTHSNYDLDPSGDVLGDLPAKPVLQNGHEMFLIGFDRKKKLYLFQNSWGSSAKWMPFDVFEKIAMHWFYINPITLKK